MLSPETGQAKDARGGGQPLLPQPTPTLPPSTLTGATSGVGEPPCLEGAGEGGRCASPQPVTLCCRGDLSGAEGWGGDARGAGIRKRWLLLLQILGSLLGMSLQILLWGVKARVLSHPCCPGYPGHAASPPGTPGDPQPLGRAGVSPALASSPGKKGAEGGLWGSSLEIAATFLTPNQPGSLARPPGRFLARSGGQ